MESGISTTAVDIGEMDVTSGDDVKRIFESQKPATVINASAFTDVDGCESRIETAYKVNATGPENLAKAALKYGSFLLHVSTDYVFDGSKGSPYLEDDAMHPLGIYAKSKADGEKFVRDIIPDNHCIVRTQWLYGLHGKNFVETIIRLTENTDKLRIVDDQFGSPTYAPDLADAMVKLAVAKAKGTFHVTNSGQTTWCDFARKIIEHLNGIEVVVEPMSTEELNRPAPRPLYAVLDNSKFREFCGFALRNWEEALSDYMTQRRKQD
jgi:dTDP-4-dehydrorhamnose reductase